MNNVNLEMIELIINEQVVDGGFRVYDVIYNQVTRTLRVYIDHPVRNVTIDDCQRMSNAICSMLDNDECGLGKYTLEVSSPGINRVLRRPEHYKWAVGKLVEIDTGRERIKGFIRNVNGEDIMIATEEGENVIKYSNIAKARIAEEIDYGKRR